VRGRGNSRPRGHIFLSPRLGRFLPTHNRSYFDLTSRARERGSKTGRGSRLTNCERRVTGDGCGVTEGVETWSRLRTAGATGGIRIRVRFVPEAWPPGGGRKRSAPRGPPGDREWVAGSMERLIPPEPPPGLIDPRQEHPLLAATPVFGPDIDDRQGVAVRLIPFTHPNLQNPEPATRSGSAAENVPPRRSAANN
jgi:hypothetical protein